MKYSAGISAEEYAGMEDGYEQGLANADSSLRQTLNHYERRLDGYLARDRRIRKMIREGDAAEGYGSRAVQDILSELDKHR